jgi:hypothetical protein
VTPWLSPKAFRRRVILIPAIDRRSVGQGGGAASSDLQGRKRSFSGMLSLARRSRIVGLAVDRIRRRLELRAAELVALTEGRAA